MRFTTQNFNNPSDNRQNSIRVFNIHRILSIMKKSFHQNMTPIKEKVVIKKMANLISCKNARAQIY